MNLVFNTAAVDPANALVRSVTQTQPAVKPVFVLGDTVSVNLYLSDGQGGYDARSGASGYTPWLGIGTPGGGPASGSFWLGVSSATSGLLVSGKRYQIQTFVAGDDFANVGAVANESGEIFTATGTTPTTWANASTVIEITTDLAYNASAGTVETALEATQAVSDAGGVTVSKPGAAPVYLVEWDSVGAVASLIGGPAKLVPDCAAVVSELRAGSSTVTELQGVRLTRQPAALQATWTQITDGWTALFSLNTQGLLELLDGAASVGSSLELQIMDSFGRLNTVGQPDCLIRNETIDEESVEPLAGPSFTEALATKVDKAGDTMSGLLEFSGTDHAGLKLISLTTAQRDALTPATGMQIWNTDNVRAEQYNGSAWVAVALHAASHGSGGSDEVTLDQSQITGLAASLSAKQDALQLYAEDFATKNVVIGGSSSAGAAAGGKVMGESCAANGDYSIATGYQATARLRGQRAHAAGSNYGLTASEYQLSRLTTDAATSYEMTIDAQSGLRLTLPNNATFAFEGILTARRTDATGDRDSWLIRGQINRDANAASTVLDALVMDHLTESVSAPTGLTSWTVSVDADTTNGALRFKVTGENSKTIRWGLVLRVTEVAQ